LPRVHCRIQSARPVHQGNKVTIASPYTHHGYTVTGISCTNGPQIATSQGCEYHRRHVVVIELEAEIKEVVAVDSAELFYLIKD